MDENFRELPEALDREGAKCFIVGGCAVGAHGHVRAKRHLDILIATSAENASAVFQGLARFGAPLAGMSATDFHDEKRSIFIFGTPPFRIDNLANRWFLYSRS